MQQLLELKTRLKQLLGYLPFDITSRSPLWLNKLEVLNN